MHEENPYFISCCYFWEAPIINGLLDLPINYNPFMWMGFWVVKKLNKKEIIFIKN